MDAQGVGRDVDVAAVDRGHPALARDAHRLARRPLGIGEERVVSRATGQEPPVAAISPPTTGITPDAVATFDANSVTMMTIPTK